MAVLNKPGKYALKFEDPSLTEQEHKDSCDINKMILNAFRGAQVRGSNAPLRYGEEDVNMTPMDIHLQREATEAELSQIAETHELEEEAQKYIPDAVKEKFKFKFKSKKTQNQNDDQTTKQNPGPNQDQSKS